jgi:hypothetical protein
MISMDPLVSLEVISDVAPAVNFKTYETSIAIIEVGEVSVVSATDSALIIRSICRERAGESNSPFRGPSSPKKGQLVS